MKMLNLFLAATLGLPALSLARPPGPGMITKVSQDFYTTPISRLAVFPLRGDFSGAAADALTTELLAMGYEVVERSSLQEVLKEMKMGHSGFIDESQRREVARLLNAEAVLFGSVSNTEKPLIYSMSLRLVDVVSGKVLWSASYLSGSEWPGTTMRTVSASLQAALGRPLAAVRPGRGRGEVRLARNGALPPRYFKRLALLPIAGTSGYGEDEALYGAVLTGLLGYGAEVVERKSLDELLGEQFMSASGVFAPAGDGLIKNGVLLSSASLSGELSFSKKDLSEIGRLTGADALLAGSFYPGHYYPFLASFVTLRVLDLREGRIAWSATYYPASWLGENVQVAAEALANAVTAVIIESRRQPQELPKGGRAKPEEPVQVLGLAGPKR